MGPLRASPGRIRPQPKPHGQLGRRVTPSNRLEPVEAHHRTGHQHKGEPPPRIPIPAHLQPPEATQPRQRPLHWKVITVGDHGGANPVDRGKPGSKLHLVCDGQGLPLAVALTAANVNDSLVFEELVDDVPAVRMPSGRRRCRPGTVHADKGYDARHCRAYLRRRGIKARIARRRIESSQRLGRQRWRVERALSWLSCYRRLQVRWDRDSARWFAFLLLACALVCCNRLPSAPAAPLDLRLGCRPTR
jgi:transposase